MGKQVGEKVGQHLGADDELPLLEGAASFLHFGHQSIVLFLTLQHPLHHRRH